MKNRYENLTDEELLKRLEDGEAEVTEYLLDKYKPLVKRQARTLYLIGGENDDLIQEGMIGLFKAIRGFHTDGEYSFYTFAELCITRQMYTAVQASKRKKHAPLNSYISLDEEPQIFTEQNPEVCFRTMCCRMSMTTGTGMRTENGPRWTGLPSMISC